MATQPRKGFVRVEPQGCAPKATAGRDWHDEPWPVATSVEGAAIQADDLPTLEQCENVMIALGLPTLPEGMRPPYYLESARNLHAIVQRSLNGDEQATKSLATLRAAFGKVTS